MSDEQGYEECVASVMRHISHDQLVDIVSGLVSMPSPTGHERPLAEWITARLRSNAVEARVQAIDDYQANVVATIPGGAGPSTLLYAPLDTFTTGDAELDVPAAGPYLRADMRAEAVVSGHFVLGLGAGNPKGHGAVVVAVVEALAASGVTPVGDVVLGLGAGGMPAFSLDESKGRQNTGHGVGAGFLLERGHTTDFAVIAKPGWTVSYEEVGLVWIDVLVHGIHTYVGSRHRLPYSNAVGAASTVALHLEEWLEGYAGRHEVRTMRPQGVVSSVSGGFAHLAASTPASVRLRMDLRITTEQTPAEVTREVQRELDEFCGPRGIDATAVQVAAVPATVTDRSSPIVSAVVAAFEHVDGRNHRPITQNSGATDANILRMRGVPTVRVGMPKVTRAPDGGPADFTLGMNIVDVREMRRLAEVLTRSILLLRDFC